MLYDTVLISVLRRMKQLRVSNLEHNLHSHFYRLEQTTLLSAIDTKALFISKSISVLIL